MKKALAILLVLSLVSMAVGGGKSDDEKVGDGTPENPIVLRVLGKDMPKNDPVTQMVLANVEKGMAAEGKYIKLEMVEIQEGTYSDSMGLMLLSGDIPDLIYFQGGDYQFGITQGILEDLTPYVANSEYLKDTLEPHSLDRLENYPYLLWMAPTRTKVPVVRKDWFDQSSTGAALMADPTPENYMAFFQELKDDFANTAAVTVTGASNGLDELDMFLGQAFGTGMSWVKDSTGEYVYTKISDGELEKLEYYAELYELGLLDNEYLATIWSEKEKQLYDGDVAVAAATQGAVTLIYNTKMVAQNGASSELIVLPPAKGEEAWSFTPADVSKEERGWAIGITSEHKQLVFDVLDFLASPAGQTIDKLGFEGEHYNIVDGEIVLTEAISAWYPRFHESVLSFDTVLPISEDTPFISEIAQSSYDMASDHASSDNAVLIPEDFIVEWDAAKATYNEFAADFVSGKKTAADWDEFVQLWKDMGGQAVTDHVNTILK